jgi:hypothetical protein
MIVIGINMQPLATCDWLQITTKKQPKVDDAYKNIYL